MGFGHFDPAELLMSLAVLLFSLSIHESAHAWTADYLGDYTARYLGRVSLNPVVHIDPIGTLLFPLLGYLTGLAVFGWAKPVPVDPLNLKNPKKDHLFIAVAGPASNVVAAVGFLLALKLMITFFPLQVMTGHAVMRPLFLLFSAGLFINVVLAVFNLIPIPPLDGSWILSGLLPDHFSEMIDGVRPYSFVLLILLLWSGFLGMILTPVLAFVERLVI